MSHAPPEIIGDTLVMTPPPELGSLDSEVDVVLADMLSRLQDSAIRHVVLDLSHVNYLGTAMLGGIVKVWKKIGLREGHLALAGVKEPVREVLRLTKLITLWPIFETRDEALRAVHPR